MFHYKGQFVEAGNFEIDYPVLPQILISKF